MLRQKFGVHKNLIFPHATADDSDLCHAAQREEVGAKGSICKVPKFKGREGVGSETDEQHFAHDAGLRTYHGRRNTGRQFSGDGCQFLRNNLSSTENVKAPIELDPDDGEAGRRGGTNAPNSRRTVHGRLDGERDKTLHFLCRHAPCLGHHNDGGGGQIREDIHFHLPCRPSARHNQQNGKEKNQRAVAKRKRYDFVQHDFLDLRYTTHSFSPTSMTVSRGNGARIFSHAES